MQDQYLFKKDPAKYTKKLIERRINELEFENHYLLQPSNRERPYLSSLLALPLLPFKAMSDTRNELMYEKMSNAERKLLNKSKIEELKEAYFDLEKYGEIKRETPVITNIRDQEIIKFLQTAND